MQHISVMPRETLDGLNVRPGGRYIDGTLGGAGHAEAILRAAGPDGRLLGFDRDAAAIERARARLAPFGDRFEAVHANFADMATIACEHGFDAVDGVLLDLGVSSFQLDDPARGFSFQHDGPLDMRMDATHGETAADLLARLAGDPDALAAILRDYGEEPRAGRIARALCEAQSRTPFTSTLQLADAVEKALGGRRGAARHPATRTFQALRIAVNGELDAVAAGLEAGLSLLSPGGRMAVITFHSLEDRIVKRVFAEHVGRWESLQAGGRRRIGREPAVAAVLRKPAIPSDDEQSSNARSRSAKLRVVERLPSPTSFQQPSMAIDSHRPAQPLRRVAPLNS